MMTKCTDYNPKKLIMSVAAFVVIVVQGAFGQLNAAVPQAQDATPRDLPRFDVATIKPIDIRPGVTHVNGADVYPNGRVDLPTVSLKSLICSAFDVSGWQLAGGEKWMAEEQYDVVAKAPEDSKPYDLRHTWYRLEDARLRQMLQALLIDRFQLKVHRETNTGQVYLLVKSGKTIPLKPTDAPSAIHPRAPEGLGSIGNAGDTWVIYNTSMRQLANFVGDFYLHRPVVDQTGLSGSYDFEWKMLLSNPDEPDPILGSKDELMQFIQVMGLKLMPSAGPVETLVIDHAERPSPN
jgi:uncharacterized protein (TIGR03435 family)